MDTIYAAFAKVVGTHGKNEAVAALEGESYKPINYELLHQKIQKLATQLSDKLKAGQHIGLMMDNGPDWVTIDLAAAYLGLVVVPIHTAYNFRYVQQILEHAGVKHFFIGEQYFRKFKDQLAALGLSKIYIAGPGVSALTKDNEVPLEKLLHGTHTHTIEPHSSVLEDVHTIVYTSGTTGRPKGVMLTHRNIVSNVMAVKKHVAVHPDDRFFSFLPLSHILERTAGCYVPLFTGASIYYARSTATIAEDMQLAQPTILISVPRIFEKAHEKIRDKFSRNHVVHAIFRKAMETGYQYKHSTVSIGNRLLYRLFDRTLFAKIRERFGGRLRFAVSGGAALPSHVGEFFESLGIIIIEGYGLTETSPILTANKLEKYKFGTVGTTIESAEIKISEAGEILAKSPGLMKGYYKAPDIIKEVIDAEGWFHTGDLGAFDDEGYLRIIGRQKEMIVLSTGRNVFPVPIEEQLEESPYISQAMVYGDSERAIAAFIVPEFEKLKEWCEENAHTYQMPDILANEKVIAFYSHEIKKLLEHFQTFEQVRHFKLLPEEFTIEDDLLTPSMKLKRKEIIEKYS